MLKALKKQDPEHKITEEKNVNTIRQGRKRERAEKVSAFYFHPDEKFNFWDPSVASVKCNTPQLRAPLPIHKIAHICWVLFFFSPKNETIAGRCLFLSANKLHFLFAVSNFSVRCSWKLFTEKKFNENEFPLSTCSFLYGCTHKLLHVMHMKNKANKMKSKNTHVKLAKWLLLLLLLNANRKWSREIYRRSSSKVAPKP